MYGAAGAIIVLIAWVYYTAQIFFLGAEFTREFALRHGSHQDEPDMPIAHTEGEEVIVERARRLVKGEDPIFVRERQARGH
jgi:uncharacterized BrkB/YihY/UPF0761 family membrane protein